MIKLASIKQECSGNFLTAQLALWVNNNGFVAVIVNFSECWAIVVVVALPVPPPLPSLLVVRLVALSEQIGLLWILLLLLTSMCVCDVCVYA